MPILHYEDTGVDKKKENKDFSLCWSNIEPGQRRTYVPSWSWAATTGTKRMWAPSDYNLPRYTLYLVSANEEWLPVDGIVKSRYERLLPGSGPTLRLTGTFYTPRLVLGLNSHPTPSLNKAEEILSGPHALFSYGQGLALAVSLYPDAIVPGADYDHGIKAVGVEMHCIVGSEWMMSRGPTCILLQQEGAHYKRIGITGNVYAILDKSTGVGR